MAAYKLKHNAESFTVVDGAFAGKTYRPGTVYAEVPPQERGRFEEIKEEPSAAASEGRPAKPRVEASKAKIIEAA